jgi:hypothetical protein
MNESPSDWVNSNFLEKACSAPLYQQAFRWFRDKYKIKFLISDDYYWITGFGQTKTESFEESELECLKKLIEIVKKQQEYESNIIV